MQKIAVVTGANRGLGLETSRELAANFGLKVIVTARDSYKGNLAISQLYKEGLDVIFHPLDITNSESIKKLKKFILNEFGRLDILVNNAGIFPDDLTNTSFFETKIDVIKKAMETNFLGTLQVCQALIPLMKTYNYGRVVNVSSGLGQLSEMSAGYTAYRSSKTALNTLTRIIADELKDTNILINSVCPGWVKTDMGGPNAIRTVEEGADTIVWLATLPDGGPTGGFFRDRQMINW